jgi:hypothetical protein
MGLGIVKGGATAAAPPRPVVGFAPPSLIIPPVRRPKTNA